MKNFLFLRPDEKNNDNRILAYTNEKLEKWKTDANAEKKKKKKKTNAFGNHRTWSTCSHQKKKSN